MTFLILGIAIAVEVLATSGLPATAGFTRPLPTLLVVSGYAGSFALIAQVVQQMPVGIVYAVWSGVGTAAVAGIGVVFLDQPLGPVKVLGLALVVLGVVALNLG